MTDAASTDSRTINVKIVNAFVQDGSGGNPAGVVLDADRLDEREMQAIAAKTGLSETAFVSRSERQAFKLDFFTPTRRIAHCGHATIGTFSVLAALGRVREGQTSKETVDGPRAIEIVGGAAFMEQLAPQYTEISDRATSPASADEVLRSLNIGADDLAESGYPVVVDTGNRFMYVGVKDVDTLGTLTPDQTAIEAISERLDLIGYYGFCRTGEDGIEATTRMFAPRYGIPEEAATGMAAGPLGCLLHDRFRLKQKRILIEQGAYMVEPSPSLLDVRLTLEDGRIAGLMVGGHGKVVGDRMVQY